MSSADRRLVARLLAGDASAFDEFFRYQVPVLYRFARRKLAAGPDGVEEVVQDSLLKIIDKLDSFRGDAALSTWMCSIAWRVIQDHQSRFYRRAETPLADEDLESPKSGAPAEADPEAAVLELEASGRVHEVLDGLPSSYGDVLEWKYIEEVPVKEIALRLGVTPKAAESTLVRARAAFRKAFQEDGGGDE